MCLFNRTEQSDFSLFSLNSLPEKDRSYLDSFHSFHLIWLTSFCYPRIQFFFVISSYSIDMGMEHLQRAWASSMGKQHVHAALTWAFSKDIQQKHAAWA
jgi:hypothetical protein